MIVVRHLIAAVPNFGYAPAIPEPNVEDVFLIVVSALIRWQGPSKRGCCNAALAATTAAS